MATPSKKPCKFGDQCQRSDCYFAHPKPASAAAPTVSTKQTSQRPCKFGNKCTRGDCWFTHPKTDTTASVPADILSNEDLAARNPAFAAALAAGMLLDAEELEELALIALDEEIADLELEINVDETN